MAKCKLCKRDIADNTEYCLDCQEKRDGKANESYLDSLLNSVKNVSEPVEKLYKKKNTENIVNNSAAKPISVSEMKKTQNIKKTNISETSRLDDNDLYRVDFSDIEDFDKFNFNADLQDMDNDIMISDEDLFGGDLSTLLTQEEEYGQNYKSEINKMVRDSIASSNQPKTAQVPVQEFIASTKENEAISGAMSDNTNFSNDEERQGEQRSYDIEAVENEKTTDDGIAAFDEGSMVQQAPVVDTIAEEVTAEDFGQNNIEEPSEEANVDLDLDELLNSLDRSNSSEEQEELVTFSDNDMFRTYSKEEPIEEMDFIPSLGGFGKEQEESLEPEAAEDEEFLKLLNQISADDPVSDSLQEINSLMSGVPLKKSNAKNMPSDVGEVFSESLKAVTSLKDFDLDEDQILNAIPDIQENNKAGTKKRNKNNVDKKTKDSKKAKKDKKPKKDKPEGNLLKRLFGNVKDDKTATQYAKEVSKESAVNEAAESGLKPKKQKGKKKDKKGVEQPNEEEVIQRGGRQGKEAGEETPSKKNKKKEREEKKRDKAEKKKNKAAIEAIDEINEDPGRINRLGASIVFILFGTIAAVLILGSSLVSYTLSIQHAADYFSKQKYTEAYYEVYGVELKDEDFELYDKIKTVMFVNKQLNSYNNYYAIGKYPEALDSLLKGLKRYDKYIELATMLGIESDLNYVRKQILAELKKKFQLTEDGAMKINSIDNMKDYSLAVYDVVLENMNQENKSK